MQTTQLTRRGVLFGSLALPLLSARSGGSQPLLNRAAVVIGVDKPAGSLPHLRAAASGARTMAAWLADEGFKVAGFFDDEGPVFRRDIYQAVHGFVEQLTFDQMVVYFAGHGFYNQVDEYWLLSDAPADPNEAIGVDASTRRARDCGIPNVVLIADACRSLPHDLAHLNVWGSVIFAGGHGSDTKVDRFLATRIGDSAIEGPLDERSEIVGVYTETFLDAFAAPEDDMIEEIDGVLVVPNHKLEGYLAQEVPRRIARKWPTLRQHPEADVPSRWPGYIGRAAVKLSRPSTGWGWSPWMTTRPLIIGEADLASIEPPALTIGDLVTLELARLDAPALSPSAHRPDHLELEQMAMRYAREASEPGQAQSFSDAVERLRNAEADWDRANASGLVVSGAAVVAAWGGLSLTDPLQIARGGKQPQIEAELDPDLGAATVILELADGAGAIIPVLRDFVGQVIVEDGGIADVSYVPTLNHWLHGAYEERREQLDGIRAVAAAATRFGAFRFTGDMESRETRARVWAEQIRDLKQLEPTLSLYAAYAYERAGLAEGVVSIMDHMRENIGLDFLDLVLLAGEHTALDDFPILPPCPMLTQGWSLVSSAPFEIAPDILQAGQHLRQALWTTFDARGMERVRRAAADGELGLWGRRSRI